jgi:hypothetical protein
VILRGNKAPVDVTFSDTLDTLDLAAMGVAEVGFGRWGIGADVIYSKFADTERLSGVLFKSVRVKLEQWLVTPRITYRLIETDSYQCDVFAGARWSSIDLAIELNGALLADRELGGGEDWWDPMVGVRGRATFAGNWFLHYNGLIGGFGVSSDFIWDALLAVGYNVNRNVSVALGYRGLGQDYSSGQEAIDVIAHGPVVGIEVRF